MRVAVLCTGYYGQRGYTHIATQPFKVFIQVTVSDALTFVNGYYNNMKPIMLSLHISCGRMKHNSQRDGVFNSHNSHMWSGSNPHAIRPQRHQDRWSVNVWAGILGNRIIGPYLLPERLTGHSYLVFLRDVLTDFLDDIPLAAIRGLWFQHDGAPAHFSSLVRDWLDMEFPGRWIGRGGPVLWPPRSPDLTPLDFFLWGHLKELVYRDLVTTEIDLVARLHGACTFVDTTLLERVQSTIPRRAHACLNMRGGHFEHLPM